ncbi:ASCH domain-containing protein [Bartonella sp. DGB1]|uniref:ASCH domain-containing protein n=1 Tax=Bartonella sp. DGB1 TaxID=3239807 RepID=UPI003525A821
MKIILSIKPEFVDKIFSGEKKYEFRKSIPKRLGISNVVVYSTLPVGKVIGEFTFRKILSLTPNALWDITKDSSGITKEFFDDYFRDKSLAHAFEIDSFNLYSAYLDISEILPSGLPPQSYCYID